MSRPSNAAQRDIESLVHPYTNLARHREVGPHVIERGEGIYVYDDKGRPFIEGMSGLWCTALGYGEEALVEAAAEQMRKLSFSHLFGGKSHDAAIGLAEKLKEMAPMPVSKVLFTNSGSEANDTQVKLAWYMNNALGRQSKKKIIARQGAYHGVTVMSASLSGLSFLHDDFDAPISGVLHADCPHHYRGGQAGEDEAAFAARLVTQLDDMIEREGPETIAAFIAEPVMGAGGVIVPPKGYFEGVQQVLKKHDVLFIDDEVICGFGRTGSMFGCESFNFTPDTMSLAKALSSAYLPIGAILIPEEMYEAMVAESEKLGMFGHGFTYAAHPVCAAVALRALELYEERDIVAHVRGVASRFGARLAQLGDHPLVGEARGIGLIGGLELVADKATRAPFDPVAGVGAKAVAFALDQGLIVRALGSTIAICPPLIIDKSEVDELFDRLDRALDETEAWVAKEGLRGR